MLRAQRLCTLIIEEEKNEKSSILLHSNKSAPIQDLVDGRDIGNRHCHAADRGQT